MSFGSAVLTVVGAVSVDSSIVSIAGGVGGSGYVNGGSGGYAGSASTTLSLLITPTTHHRTSAPTPTYFFGKPTNTPTY